MLVAGIGVYAYGTNAPATFGHSAGEIGSGTIDNTLTISGGNVNIKGTASIFGPEISSFPHTVFNWNTALSDGFVVGEIHGRDFGGTKSVLQGYVDYPGAVAHVRGSTTWYYTPNDAGLDQWFSFTMPVRKGEKWDVITGGVNDVGLIKTVYWIPLGNP